MENALYHLENFEATLDVYEDRCVISAKKSFDAFMSGRSFAGAKEFYYADLTAVQYREARTLTAGYIQFEYPGSEGTGKKNPYASENTFAITLRKTTAKESETVFNFIRQKVAEYKKKPLGQAVSSADELKKFKELLDSGIISQEEFDAKKKQLLGL